MLAQPLGRAHGGEDELVEGVYRALGCSAHCRIRQITATVLAEPARDPTCPVDQEVAERDQYSPKQNSLAALVAHGVRVLQRVEDISRGLLVGVSSGGHQGVECPHRQ